MMDPRLKALMSMIEGYNKPEYSDENLEIKIEADNPKDAAKGLKIAKETLGEVQDLTKLGKKKKKGM